MGTAHALNCGRRIMAITSASQYHYWLKPPDCPYPQPLIDPIFPIVSNTIPRHRVPARFVQYFNKPTGLTDLQGSVGTISDHPTVVWIGIWVDIGDKGKADPITQPGCWSDPITSFSVSVSQIWVSSSDPNTSSRTANSRLHLFISILLSGIYRRGKSLESTVSRHKSLPLWDRPL